MVSCYSAVIFLSWLALFALCVCVRENNRLTNKDKRLYNLTYALIAVSALAEWLGIQLTADDHLQQQERQINTDALTGGLNRYAYSKALAQLAREADLAMYEAKRAYYLETGRPRRDPRVDFSAERDG